MHSSIRAEVKTYPSFKDEDGVFVRVKCTGHTVDEATDEALRSHWQLWEHYGGDWRMAASTVLSGYAQKEHAIARLI